MAPAEGSGVPGIDWPAVISGRAAFSVCVQQRDHEKPETCTTCVRVYIYTHTCIWLKTATCRVFTTAQTYMYMYMYVYTYIYHLHSGLPYLRH